MAWTGKLAGRSDDAPKLADQIKMHSDMIVIRRDRDLGWSGTIIDDHQIQLYRLYFKTRKFSWVMTRKLSETLSRNFVHSCGMVSRMNARMASANCF